jgi:hypothetical protein
MIARFLHNDKKEASRKPLAFAADAVSYRI